MHELYLHLEKCKSQEQKITTNSSGQDVTIQKSQQLSKHKRTRRQLGSGIEYVSPQVFLQYPQCPPKVLLMSLELMFLFENSGLLRYTTFEVAIHDSHETYILSRVRLEPNSFKQVLSTSPLSLRLRIIGKE